MSIPVIDVFAGPGGLGEGFCSLGDGKQFEVVLSIEKDKNAWQTLLLRSFFRQYPNGEVPDSYYKFIRQKGYVDIKKFNDFISDDPEAIQKFERAKEIALNIELGKNGDTTNAEVDRLINNALSDEAGKVAQNWVLVGGPPCQAYSVVGRSRKRGIDPNDPRVNLYREYYRILAVHSPPVFVMENVKGLLSAKVEESPIFQQILEDIKDPVQAYRKLKGQNGISLNCPGYHIYSFVKKRRNQEAKITEEPEYKHKDFIIKSEDYGIPQARHRVILLGIRKDYNCLEPRILEEKEQLNVRSIIGGIPSIRSGLSKRKDSSVNWRHEILKLRKDVKFEKREDEKLWVPDSLNRAKIKNRLNKAFKFKTYFVLDSVKKKYPKVADRMLQILGEIENSRLESRGAEYIKCECDISSTDEEIREWFLDNNIEGICNHTARGHMGTDLHRYLFLAVFAEVKGSSPKLADFPLELLPNHVNVFEGVRNAKFADRFRVQMWNEPAKTITSHISKDGHYYIHPAPNQCRSLTVREAARLQTFPDNYFFCGPRTSQYVQVGNAVPPILAKKLAKLVRELIRDIKYERSTKEVKEKV